MDILLTLDRSERRGLREQLQQQLRSAIQQGRLVPGTLLPPSRTLARDLGVARSVVVDTYEYLAADGYLGGRQGSGTRVLPIAQPVFAPPTASTEPDHAIRFVGGLPDPALFPRAEWLRHYRAALNDVPNRRLGYPGPHGAQPLRDALTNYVGRVRGVAATPDRVVVTGGLTQALVLVCRALRSRGVEAVAVEDPGFGFHREAISNTGLRVVPISVDDDGLDVAGLARHDVGAVLVAPAHSYPTGAVLGASRRSALVKWAEQHDGLVIEDDYDAEFRYDRAPIGALQGLAPERVAYAGCASKMLTPALRLGWIVLPGWLVQDVVREKLFDDMGTTMLEQLALARFIEAGGLTRHLRRVRPIYRGRRDATLEALSTSLPGTAPTGVAAGLHVYVRLPSGCDELNLVDTARKRGVLIEGATWHWADPRSAPPALVLGYGSIAASAIRDGLAVLGSIYRSAS
jgi:GntR family transcriptional regulator/MocR family aminotransferase